MNVFKKVFFDDLRDIDSGEVFQDMIFEKCSFMSCSFSYTSDVHKRSKARKITFKNCEQKNCQLFGGILEDIEIENLATHNILWSKGTFFKHVTLKGKMGRMVLSNETALCFGEEVRSNFILANENLYKEVDWCLDISGAVFKELDIRGVPAKYIIRNPDNQVVITKESLKNADLSRVDFKGTYFKTAIGLFRDSYFEDTILTAPMMRKDSGKYLEVLDQLVKEGIAYR